MINDEDIRWFSSFYRIDSGGQDFGRKDSEHKTQNGPKNFHRSLFETNVAILILGVNLAKEINVFAIQLKIRLKQMGKISGFLIKIGVLIISAALVWWHSFYRVIAQQLLPSIGESDPTLGVAVQCIYNTQHYCGEIIRSAESLGKTVYNPWMFWIGVGILIFGVIIYGADKLKNRK